MFTQPSPSFTVAVDAFVRGQARGLHETTTDLVRSRALRHYGEGLRQYLTLRLGDSEKAQLLFKELQRQISAWPSSKMLEPPSPRAHMYHLARALCQKEIAVSLTALPWREPTRTSKDYSDLLHAIRVVMPELEREVIELRMARELSVPEIAYVLNSTEEAVAAFLLDAETRIAQWRKSLRKADDSPFSQTILDAFALRVDRASLAQSLEEDAPALPTDTILGQRYQLECRVGIGAFSDVYRAKDTEVLGHVVALKILRQPAVSEQAKEKALHELRLIAAVFHPSIVHFKDHGWYEDRLWFVMPWYEGETLEQRMLRKKLSPREARVLFEPLARALSAMHALNIRHQDVKPENILLAQIKKGPSPAAMDDVLPVLLDLGVAVRESEVLIAGTPMYFAPEVAARFSAAPAQPPITPKADVFALALSLRNALEPETQEDIPGAAMDAFIQYRATHVPAMPQTKALQPMVPYFRRWMSLRPEERPDAAAFAAELAALTAPEERRAKRNRFIKRVVPLLVALGAIFVATIWVLRHEAEIQSLRAERARFEAKGVRAALNVEQSRRESLEQDRLDLVRKYEQSRFGRKQLASELASKESQLRFVVRTLGSEQEKRERAELQLSELQEQLSTNEEALSQAHSAVQELRTELNQQRTHSTALQEQLTEAQSHVQNLSDQLHTTQENLRQTLEQVRSLEQERNTLQTQLETLQHEIERLKTGPITAPTEL